MGKIVGLTEGALDGAVLGSGVGTPTMYVGVAVGTSLGANVLQEHKNIRYFNLTLKAALESKKKEEKTKNVV